MNTSAATLVLSQKSRLGVVIAKDGGWGWVVVFAAFMMNLLALGLTFSLGHLMTELAIDFKESKYATAWVISIAFGISYCIGPVVSGLINRYGCRAVTISGSLMACFGMLISMPAPNLLYLYFTFGPAIGCGIGMIVLPSVIIVNSYFENKRAIATGFSMCGSGVGTLIMPHLTKYIISYYHSWRSALLIMGGIFLNCAVFGSLYRQPVIRAIPVDTFQDDESDQGIVIFEPIPEVQEEYLPETSSDWKHLFTESNVDRTQSEPILVKEFKQIPIRKAHSLSELDDFESQERERGLDISKTLSFLRPFQHHLKINKDFDLSKLTTTTTKRVHSAIPSSRITTSQRSRASHTSKIREGASGLLYRKDIFFSASLVTVPEYRDNAPEYYESLVTSVVEIEEVEKERKWYTISREVWDALKEMMDFSLLKDQAFQVILLSRFVACLGYMAPYYYIVEACTKVGISNGKEILSLIGICNMFGRLSICFIANHKSVNRILLYKIFLGTTGVMIASIGACYTFICMTIVAGIYGFTAGVYPSLLPIILVDVLGIAKLTNAYGLVMFFQGIAYMIGLPIPGFLYDVTGSYAPAFLISGLLVFSSALIACFIPFCVSLKSERGVKQRVQSITTESIAKSYSNVF